MKVQNPQIALTEILFKLCSGNSLHLYEGSHELMWFIIFEICDENKFLSESKGTTFLIKNATDKHHLWYRVELLDGKPYLKVTSEGKETSKGRTWIPVREIELTKTLKFSELVDFISK